MALLFTRFAGLRRFRTSASAARCALCRQGRLATVLALVVADAGQLNRRRRRSPCALGHVNRPAGDIRAAGGVVVEELRLWLQH